ncbi:unnamed protein product [Rotaria sordida]|uniref:Uncharacterized protein n=1 Tax=Rotaria sordida TaxID=392033 RepID=A0A819X1T0_9BILA|nr:unnamed protein product [Rotaria sordida]CAF1438193.1 unnamed protein product [Rotaria sordida]CAF1602724.1 unnamed protein product [Rotaria sordida]CAF3892095.1 unnamed protein product [Rotaria sordida]CAF4133094.1 unnamed protein product [Rotaria sordida]
MEPIVKLIGYNHSFSSVYHPQMAFAYNIGIHATTNYSPFQLQFGRESCLPTDEPSSSLTFNKPTDYYVQLENNLLIIQQHARDNIIHQQRQYKINYDKQRPDPYYEINDPVLIKIHGIKKKLEQKYSITPKIITRKQNPIY